MWHVLGNSYVVAAQVGGLVASQDENSFQHLRFNRCRWAFGLSRTS